MFHLDEWFTKKWNLSQEVSTISYLVYFSFLGTLARVGLQNLTSFHDAPVSYSVVWPNFAGSLFMGFLVDDVCLFRQAGQEGEEEGEEEEGEGLETEEDQPGSTTISVSASSSAIVSALTLERDLQSHLHQKKKLPLYLGLTTGFCGSLTSFSALIRDVFLAFSDDLVHPVDLEKHAVSSREARGGLAFMGGLSVLLASVALAVTGYQLGTHTAQLLSSFPFRAIPRKWIRRGFDRGIVFLAIASLLVVVFLSIFAPNRDWRGQILFALVFSPVGCLLRYYISRHYNLKWKGAKFPLGTFLANVLGTIVLGVTWDLAHAQPLSLGSLEAPQDREYRFLVSCQVLRGIADGFCGCLTTVSTFMAELHAQRHSIHHAYVYGVTSLVVPLCTLIAIMGGLRWSRGFEPMSC